MRQLYYIFHNIGNILIPAKGYIHTLMYMLGTNFKLVLSCTEVIS